MKQVKWVGRNDLHNTFSVKYHKPHYVPGYKGMYLNQLAVNKGLLIALGIVTATGFILTLGTTLRFRTELEALRRSNNIGITMSSEFSKENDLLKTELASCSAKLPKPKVSKGKVSYYSEKGCLGCNAGLIMSNRQVLDDDKLTLAHNQIPLNTWVTVKNLDNGLFTKAQVTDRGGFNSLGRIADLSVATCKAINCKTDVTNVEISY